MAAMTSLSEYISEKEWQATVVEYATLHGWLAYHTYDSRRSVPGFPDLVMVRPGRLVFAELKSEKGKIQESQQEWIDTLALAGQKCHVWRPSDWSTVEKVLA